MKKKTPQSYYVPDVVDVRVDPQPRGAIVKVLFRGRDTYNQIVFRTKKEAKEYYKWITGNVEHPIHKVRLELKSYQGQWEVTDLITDEILF